MSEFLSLQAGEGDEGEDLQRGEDDDEEEEEEAGESESDLSSFIDDSQVEEALDNFTPEGVPAVEEAGKVYSFIDFIFYIKLTERFLI